VRVEGLCPRAPSGRDSGRRGAARRGVAPSAGDRTTVRGRDRGAPLGDPEPALGAFAAADRLPVADYLGYLRVEALVRSDDLAGARRAAEALAARFPDGRVGRAVLLLAAQLAARRATSRGRPRCCGGFS